MVDSGLLSHHPPNDFQSTDFAHSLKEANRLAGSSECARFAERHRELEIVYHLSFAPGEAFPDVYVYRIGRWDTRHQVRFTSEQGDGLTVWIVSSSLRQDDGDGFKTIVRGLRSGDVFQKAMRRFVVDDLFDPAQHACLQSFMADLQEEHCVTIEVLGGTQKTAPAFVSSAAGASVRAYFQRVDGDGTLCAWAWRLFFGDFEVPAGRERTDYMAQSENDIEYDDDERQHVTSVDFNLAACPKPLTSCCGSECTITLREYAQGWDMDIRSIFGNYYSIRSIALLRHCVDYIMHCSKLPREFMIEYTP